MQPILQPRAITRKVLPMRPLSSVQAAKQAQTDDRTRALAVMLRGVCDGQVPDSELVRLARDVVWELNDLAAFWAQRTDPRR